MRIFINTFLNTFRWDYMEIPYFRKKAITLKLYGTESMRTAKLRDLKDQGCQNSLTKKLNTSEVCGHYVSAISPPPFTNSVKLKLKLTLILSLFHRFLKYKIKSYKFIDYYYY